MGRPAGPTADTTRTFALQSDEPNSTLECRLDSGAFDPCTSPVPATDAASNTDLTPDSRSFSVDATPPQTKVIGGPSGTTGDSTPTFTLQSEAGATFECSLDGARFAPCASPQTAKVGRGRHVWADRATDVVGNHDRSPATAKFKVKRKRR